jgi:hypothetical protein
MSLWKRLVAGNFRKPRKEDRIRVDDSLLECRVVCFQNQKSLQVQMLDISRTGMAFATKEATLEVGQSVRIFIYLPGDDAFDLEGLMVSQFIFYPPKTEDLKYAVFRFSVRFETEMNEKMFNKVKRSVQQNATAI